MNIVDELTAELQKKQALSILFLLASVSVFLAVAAGTLFGISSLLQCLTWFGFFATGTGAYAVFGGFSKPREKAIVRFLDRNFPFLEESGYLFTRPPKTIFEEWQLEKIQDEVHKNRAQIQLPGKKFRQNSLLSAGLLVSSIFLILFQSPSENSARSTENPRLTDGSSPAVQNQTEPSIQHAEIVVTPPAYTNLPEHVEEPGNLTVAEMSGLEWKITANGSVDSVQVTFNDRSHLSLEKKDGVFTGSVQIRNHHIYQIEITGNDTTVVSDYYGISVVKDEPPRFRFTSPAEQRSFITEENREFSVDVQIVDDFGVMKASVNATLARGTGENVRFRERILVFDNLSDLGTDRAHGQLILNADSLEMEPGDELYFYVTATDNHPETQTGRSETYFVVYQDTTRSSQQPFGNVVVDLMPEYLRSQRQIIIDTEQLLDEMPELSEEEAGERSNRIGRDQGLLRLRYGQYLGIENESGIMGDHASHDEHGPEGENDDHNHEEHEDLDDMGLERSESSSAAITPDDFMHDHGSAEMNTLFADSPRQLLQESLANMWDAERYLRTHQPERALAYEYRALELLKEAQQANRQYVRRAGYESAPIPVDEKRLTRTYDDFGYPRAESQSDSEPGPLEKLEVMIRENSLAGEPEIEQANLWIQQAEIPDESRLFLLNRLRRVESEGFTPELRKQLLERLIEHHQNRSRNPAPLQRPVLLPTSGEK